ncbi:MAG: LpxL/LpxP family Kdo(2)-lipid IV(A) lauroyl/palmitoleoyl acyltransferase [Gammaproteobacteria bacterium]
MSDRKLYAPRYWPAWSLVAVFFVLGRLPWRLQLALGRLIGRIARRLAHRRRAITLANLALCFPEMSESDRGRLLDEHFESLGIAIPESAAGWWKPTSWLLRRAHVEGLDRLQAALAEGRGALLLTAHFTTLEIGAQMLAAFHPTLGVYRQHENPVFDRVIRGGRLSRGSGLIERSDLRALLRALRSGAVAWYAPDQAYLGPRGVEASFFGVPAPTNTATSRIAAASGAPVLPFFVERLPGMGGYRLCIESPLADFPSDDPTADAARVNAVLEAGIRRVPAQYLWSHDRFKRFRRP